MTDILTADDKEAHAGARFRDICDSATIFISTFDATDVVGVVIGAVIAKLRIDSRMPRLTLNQWDEILRDALLDAEDILEQRGLSGLAPIYRVVNVIVDALVEKHGRRS